jgi:hypothetical protein
MPGRSRASTNGFLEKTWMAGANPAMTDSVLAKVHAQQQVENLAEGRTEQVCQIEPRLFEDALAWLMLSKPSRPW